MIGPIINRAHDLSNRFYHWEIVVPEEWVAEFPKTWKIRLLWFVLTNFF